MNDNERLVQELDAARAHMRATVAACNVERELYPGWTIKQVLAHITGWDDATIAALRAHGGGVEPGTPAALGINHYNAQSVATREGLNYRQIVAEWEQARETLKAAINEMPPEKFKEKLLYPWGPTGSVKQLVEIMIHHEHEHADEISKLVVVGSSQGA